MINTDLTRKAMAIAYNAHHGQNDKDGVPYIFHPIHVAESMTTEYETIAALLHDVVEDTDITIEDLIDEGFPDDVIEAIRLLTHEKGIGYCEYLESIKTNAIATTVKLADLAHNSDETRLASLDKATANRLRDKYTEAKRFMAEVSLCDERLPSDIHVYVTAEMIDNKLRISGQDLGAAIEEIFGGNEYEYWYDFDDENTCKLRKALLENAPSDDFLQAVKKHFSGVEGCAALRSYCEERNIKYKFSSYSSF
jgi:hypothetical protein